jgi:hypothetical protein
MKVEKGVLDYFYQDAREVEFDPRWINGTGYFDNIINSIHRGVFRFIDQWNRKVVVISTEEECMVINQRFRDGDKDVVVVHKYKR